MRNCTDTFDDKGITMKVAIGGDHAGFELKKRLKECFDWEWVDVGSTSTESCDYPDFAHALCNAVESGEAEWGILICGSANGMAMAANKHAFIRCAICWNEELANLAKAHNNANVLALPARFITMELAVNIVKSFASSPFEGGRHQRRVEKIAC